MTIVLDLPLPPSVNRIWRSGRGRVYKSAAYRGWLAAADAQVLASGYPKQRIAGAFTAHIIVGRCRGDIDNRAKALLDWLQSREVIRNDKDCTRLTIERGDVEGCRVVVAAQAEAKK
jgi:Holliday junction resolvase RusA-like endonuclease